MVRRSSLSFLLPLENEKNPPISTVPFFSTGLEKEVPQLSPFTFHYSLGVVEVKKAAPVGTFHFILLVGSKDRKVTPISTFSLFRHFGRKERYPISTFQFFSCPRVKIKKLLQLRLLIFFPPREWNIVLQFRLFTFCTPLELQKKVTLLLTFLLFLLLGRKIKSYPSIHLSVFYTSGEKENLG